MFRQKIAFILRKFSITRSNLRPDNLPAAVHPAFGKYLICTNTATCGFLMFLGDLIQQEIEYRQKALPKRYDLERLTRMLIVGITMGPVHHLYYKYINLIFPKRNFNQVFIKIICDQIIMSPICITQFFILDSILEGKSWKDNLYEFTSKFNDVYLFDWCVWPPVQSINFYFIPVRFQVMYISSATMLYNVYLSYKKNKIEV